ncbi:hypothetical protein PSAB6_340106 [Paraburkholderia sabiae]|nr:hypothetical protein PSAB6_340106 [Paraburkholderia sabiae]
MRDDGSGWTQPRLEAVVTDAGHDGRDEVPSGRTQFNRLARAGGLRAHSRQRVLTGPGVGHLGTTCVEDCTIDFAEARALIRYAGLGRGHEDHRRGAGRIRDEWLGRAGAEQNTRRRQRQHGAHSARRVDHGKLPSQ